MTQLRRLSPKILGTLVLVLFLAVGWAAFQKERLSTWFTVGHETIQAEFAGRAKLIGHDLTYVHSVKLNGVVIGKVTTIEETPRGTMLASMQVDPGTREKLGSAPTAFLRPTLVTDGVQYLGLRTGGDLGKTFVGDVIPLERTQLPVYLDDVLLTLSGEDAKQGLRSTIGQTDATLRQGGADAIHALVADAPAALNPAGVVLGAFRGTNPDTDLTKLVTGLHSISAAMNRQQGQFSSTLASLDRTTTALAAGSGSLASAISGAPETLRVTRAGMDDLRPALARLRTTSEEFRPSARELDEFLHEFGPVAHRARPVFDDLRQVMHDARPLLDQLVPAADVGNDVLDDIKGPVLDRVNGPIKDRIYAPFVGKNEYHGGSVDIPTYKELGYLISASSNVFKHYDANNAIGRLEAGAGGNSIGGTKFPHSLEQYLEMFGMQQPLGPNEPKDGPLGRIEPDKAKPSDALPLLGGTR